MMCSSPAFSRKNVYVPGNLQILLVISEQDTHNTSMVLRRPTNNFPYVLVHVNSEKRKYLKDDSNGQSLPL
jgi:hypothetical protein